MRDQVKQSHLLVPSIVTLSAASSFVCFLVLAVYLSFNILIGRSYPLGLLIWLYILCNLISEYLFWKDWRKKISENLKTKEWSLSFQYHINFIFGFFWIGLDVLCEVLLIKGTLNAKFPIIWAFLALIGSKAIGSLIMFVSCRIIGRKNTIMPFFVIVSCIILILIHHKEGLPLNWVLPLILVKGLLGNLFPLAKTVIADHMDVKH